MSGGTRRPLPLSAYEAATTALSPLAAPLLARRAKRGKEDADRLTERLGRPAAPRPDGPLVWLHGASVGESLLAPPLIARLSAARPDLDFLVTSGTLTSAAMLATRLPAPARHQFAPVDTPGAVCSFLDHWRPDIGVLLESELWPNLIGAAAARGVSLALANARMTAGSLRGWSRFPGSARWLLGQFAWIGAADALTAQGLSGLAHRDIASVGNLKLDAPPPTTDAQALADLQAAIGDRPVWCAASTHAGEEAIVLEAHKALRFGLPDSLLILSPRHPERGDEVEALIRETGFSLARRSRGEAPTPATDVYLADTLGEMGVLLRAAPVVLLGGSLVPGIGGHNPVEPVQLGAALISGPNTDNFAAIYDALEAEGGAAIAADAGEIALRAAALLADPDARAAMPRAAEAVMDQARGALDRTAAALLDLLPPPATGEGAP